MRRSRAVSRLESILALVESDTLPVPIRELWVYGDVALGLDPIERLNVYVTKDLLLRGDADAADAFEATHGVKGVGKTISAEWAEANPELVRTNASGYAAPEKCLAAQLLPADEPAHLEVCNAPFEDNVRQRLKGALARDAYEEILDPRGVCLYAEGQRSDSALEKLRDGNLAFPTLTESLSMLGLDEDTAEKAAAAVSQYRSSQSGRTVRGDVV
ncbi:DUF7095 family protein [Halobellus captivus]|uniref:DUF7095 family protein n=1 Tax=Halobellus captivus TaxID=2592614 RepID=UPI00119F975E|nr:hypothetical protein [Halobellus captivus]